jgi:hypothetical protein
LSVLIATAGTGWIILGCSLRYGFSWIVSGNTGYKVSAVALVLLAGMISIQLLRLT